jgi:hypothetical protein
MPYLYRLVDGTDSDIDLYLLSVAGFPSDRRRQRAWFDRARNTRTQQILEHEAPERLPDDLIHERVIAGARRPRFELVRSACRGRRAH